MTAPRSRPRGFTLVELMVTVAVTAILLMAVVPSFSGLLARLRLGGAANELSTDLQFARSEALRNRLSVRLVLNDDRMGYRVETVEATPRVLKTVALPSGMSIAESGVTITYDALRALANDATLTGSISGTTATLRVIVNAMGRVQLCSPSATFTGYPECS